MGYKAKFSPQFSRSKCKPSPLLFLPWDSVGGVGQGGFRILHKSGIDSMALGALQGWPSGLGCWDGWRHGWSAWAVASSGAGVPGSLGWVGLALPCWPCVLSASAGCWLCLASSGAGSPLVPAGLCWALTAWGLLGAGSGSAWASLAPGSPPGCRAGGCPGRAGGGGWAG